MLPVVNCARREGGEQAALQCHATLDLAALSCLLLGCFMAPDISYVYKRIRMKGSHVYKFY